LLHTFLVDLLPLDGPPRILAGQGITHEVLGQLLDAAAAAAVGASVLTRLINVVTVRRVASPVALRLCVWRHGGGRVRREVRDAEGGGPALARHHHHHVHR
jgi:hypothetical protein